jgi:hypothetical protein
VQESLHLLVHLGAFGVEHAVAGTDCRYPVVTACGSLALHPGIGRAYLAGEVLVSSSSRRLHMTG